MSQQRVLVVGASGRLGSKVVRELLARGAAVRASHRPGAAHDQITALRASGAEPVAADLDEPNTLDRACAGVDVVVSCVQGLRDVIIDGQTRLLRAAERARVARMLPSDFALDFFKTPPGQNRNLDLRRTFHATLDASPVRGTAVLCGAFMDLLVGGQIGPDRATGRLKVWGDPDQPSDYTHTDDVARYLAAVALDASAGPVVRIAGDTRSPRELAELFAAARGVPVPVEEAGTLGDLDALIAKLMTADPAPTNPFPVWQQLQYVRDMASGLGRLDPLDNARYPDITPRSIRDVLTT